MRNTDLVIADIQKLIKSKGYIYAFCLILYEDFHVDIETLHKVDYKSKLSVKEATLILGFIIQKEIDFSIPNSPESVIEMKEKTYILMRELQSSYLIPQIDKFSKLIQHSKSGIKIEDTFEEKFDFFVGNGSMVEPMFYAGDGVYDFQYLEYLESKYKYDRDWLMDKKQFDTLHAIQITNSIKEILHEKSKKVNLVGLREVALEIKKEAKKKSKKKYKEEDFNKFLISAEFYQYVNLFPFPPIDKNIDDANVRSENWICFYQNLLDLFIVRRSQLPKSAQVHAFIDNFSFNLNHDTNKDFKGFGYFNIINSKPIIRIDEDRLFIPLNYLIAEAVYESPFYWMCEDKDYSDSLAKHRGDVGEEMAYQLLSKVFGKRNTFKSVIITTKKGYRDTDIDILCVLGSKALCVQVKSKKLTLLAKRGDANQLIKDFKGSVQDAYNQGIISRNKILKKDAKFFDERGNEIILSEDITEVYIMGITTENYPALTHQSYVMLKKEEEEPFPIFLSIFDLELLAYYLNDPYDFLYYVRQRVSLMDYFRADEEIVYLGYHLMHKLWRVEDADFVSLETDFGSIVDRNYYPFKAGYSEMVTDSNDPIKKAWKDENFDKLCFEIKRHKASQVTDIIFHLLDWSAEGRNNVVSCITKTKQQTVSDGEIHTFSTSSAPHFGICYISLNTNERNELTNKLLQYSMARKYKSKCNAWLGIGSLIDSPHMIDCLVYNDELWEYNTDLEALANQLLDHNKNRKIISFSNKKKIGRNDPCPCNSGLKFKKCCGKAVK